MAGFFASVGYLAWQPDVAKLKGANPSTTAYIELRKDQARAKGKTLELHWTWAKWDDISEDLKHAVLTAEDDTFYRHHGVDWDAMRTAFDRDLSERKLAYGASTITQQVARNLYLSPSKNPLRKLKEALIAWRLEKALGKRRIFELYLNIAEWGKGIFGAEAASQAYFGKHASELSADEAVSLAVVLPSPLRHDPGKGGRYIDRNSRRVMARMRMSGYLPDEDAGEFEVYTSTELELPALSTATAAP